MSTFTVTTLDDELAGTTNLATEMADGNGLSLREAIAIANADMAADTISFHAALAGGTLILTNGELLLTSDITIDGDTNGDDKADITISGNNSSRIFSTGGATTDLSFLSLTMTNGNSGVGNGGAIYGSYISTLTIQDSTISNSSAAKGGAALIYGVGTTTITDTLMTGNSSTYEGGALYVKVTGNTVTLQNTTLYNNSSGYDGGAVRFLASFGSNSYFNLYNSNITGNQANTSVASTSGGGGLQITGSSGGYFAHVQSYNSVIADNVSGSTPADNDVQGTIENSTNSFFETNVTIANDLGGNQVNAGNPGLYGLADNGGTTNTQNAQTGSPLINAGNNASVPGGLTEDANGNTRIQDTNVDIGATEAAPTGPVTLTVTTLDDETAATSNLATELADGNGLSLREAIAVASAGDTIEFDAAITGGTTAGVDNGVITLTNGVLALTQDITIDGDTNGDNRADILVSGNFATRIFDISGGALTTIQSLTLFAGYDGTGTGGGAAIRVDGAGLVLADSLLLFNETSGTTGGGAIDVRNSTTAFNQGAFGPYLYAGTVLSNVSFIANYSQTGSGGSLYADSSDVAVLNSTIYGSRAGNLGGGIFANTSDLFVFSSTVVGNQAYTSGGGILGSGSDIYFSNSVVAQNFSDGSTGYTFADDVTDLLGYISSTASFFGATVTLDSDNGFNQNGAGDPLLGGFLDNGGPVPTMSPLNTTASTSPLIDAGEVVVTLFDFLDADGDNNTTEAPPFDARGATRISGADIDIGAVEQFNDETIRGFDVFLPIFTGLDETLIGGLGNDVLQGGPGADTLNGGAGTDSLDGGAGSDTADYSDKTSGVEVRLNVGTAVGASAGSDTLISIENVEGSNFNDLIFGDDFANILNGNDGDDEIYALGENDIVNGGAGNDTLNGNLDADTLNGDAGDDLILGAQGNDILNGGDDNDIVSGGSGEDTVTGGAGNDEVLGGGDNDMLFGNEGNDTLSGGGGNDTADGGDDDDLVLGAGGNDTVLGGDGMDTVSGGTGIDIVDGGAGNDTVFGADGDDTEVRGGADNDTVSGGTGNDNVFGDSGDDNVIGASGDDRLDGGTGTDSLTGGIGFDTLVFGLGYGSDSVGGFEDDIDTLELDEDLWIGTHGVLTAAQVVAMFSTQTGGGTIDFTFDGGDTLRVTQGAGILQADLIDDITIV